MKKIVVLMSLVWLLLSCSDNDIPDDVNLKGKDLPSLLTGTWVYENHETKEGTELHCCEELSFASGNLLSYSNYYDKTGEGNDTYYENNDVEAFYEINGRDVYITNLAGNALLLSGDNHIYSLSDIGNLEMDVITRVDNSEIIHKYCKIIGEYDVYDEPIIPDYQALLPNVHFQRFSTINEYIAKVDESTGEITAESSGTTYIYTHTDIGIAAVRVIVKSLHDIEYDAYLGQPIDSVPTNSGISNRFSQKHSGNWESIKLHIDKSLYVDKITMKARNDAWFSIEDISGFLNGHYYPYEWNSTNYRLSYINAPSIKDATICVYWDTLKKELCFEKKRDYIEIGKESYLPDYRGLLGDVQILRFSSANPYIATVDNSTGVVSGIDSGTTYIIVYTSEGKITIDVSVKIFLADDYESIIGCSGFDFNSLYNTVPLNDYDFEDSSNHYYFNFDSYFMGPISKRGIGNWKTMRIWMLPVDNALKFVIQIVLTAKDNTWFEAEEMTEFLSQKYRQDIFLSNGTRKFFVNSEDDDAVTVSIIWDESSRTLTFERFSYF